MMYVPRGFGHGFVTLTDHVEALYLDSAFYSPEAERGLRWNDPAIGIDWPAEPQEMSDKDRKWPDLNPKYPWCGIDARPDVNILLTGASSFTGYWFAKGFVRGWASRGRAASRAEN